MQFYRCELQLNGKTYVHFYLCTNPYEARLKISYRYGNKNATRTRIDLQEGEAQTYSLRVMFINGVTIPMNVIAICYEHAECLVYEKHNTQVKEIQLWDGQQNN